MEQLPVEIVHHLVKFLGIHNLIPFSFVFPQFKELADERFSRLLRKAKFNRRIDRFRLRFMNHVFIKIDHIIASFGKFTEQPQLNHVTATRHGDIFILAFSIGEEYSGLGVTVPILKHDQI